MGCMDQGRRGPADDERPADVDVGDEALVSVALSEGVPEEIIAIASRLEPDERRRMLIRLIAEAHEE